MNLGEELAGEHSSVLNSTIGRLIRTIRSRNVPTLRSRMLSELQGALRRSNHASTSARSSLSSYSWAGRRRSRDLKSQHFLWLLIHDESISFN